VLTIARCCGLEWDEHLPVLTAKAGKLELLQWLIKCGCPIDSDEVVNAAVEREQLEVIIWLYEKFASLWSARCKKTLMWRAGWLDKLPMVKWLLEHGAEWPEAFCCNANLTTFQPLGDHGVGCWSLQCVQWAIANGCTWGQWRCQHYDVTLYDCSCNGAVHDDASSGSAFCDMTIASQVFK
jgi:hypothetical protein